MPGRLRTDKLDCVSLRDEAVAVGEAATDVQRFFDAVRETNIPFAACAPDVEPGQLLLDTIDALYLIGRSSLPLAVGLTMHQYMTGALGTMPVEIPTIRPLLDRMKKERLLLAVGSFGDNIRAAGKSPDTVRIEDGRAKGRTNFTSIASQADVMSVVADSGTSLGFYVVSLQGAKVGAPLFEGTPMADADTRTVEIDTPVTRDNLITDHPYLTEVAMFYSTAWFEAIVSAAYLGAASRAIDEARAFARSVARGDGTTLADVDGVHVEIGRMVIALKAALQTARGVAPALGAFAGDGKLVDKVNHLAERAAIAKHTCTRTAEEIVHDARRFIGTRSMRPNSVIQRLTGQIVFGPLHPKVAAIFERGAGEETLAMDEFVGLD